MIQVKLSYKSGCILYYVMHCSEGQFEGGIDKHYHFFVDPACPYKELMFRTLVNKCMDTPFQHFTADDEWGISLPFFGFRKEGDVFVAAAQDMKLPSACSCCKK